MLLSAISEGMNTPIYDKWLNSFKKVLKAQGYGAQSRLAEKVGKTVKHISDIKVERKRASLELQEEIAKALGYTYQELIALDDPVMEKEPFQKYGEVMKLPLEERGWAIARIAAEKYGITGFMSFSGGRDAKEKPELIQRFLNGELNEEGFYKEACLFFEAMEERIKAEFAKRGF